MDAARKDASRPTPRRRFGQFRIRTLFRLTTLAIVALVLGRGYSESFRQQREAADALRKAGAIVNTRPGAFAALRAQFGEDQFQNVVHVDFSSAELTDDLLAQIGRLPRLETLAVGGNNFGDAQLDRLVRLHRLRHLVLDSTSASRGGIERLQAALPKTEIHVTHRRWIAELRKKGQVTADLDGPPELRVLFGNESFEHPLDVWFSDVEVDAETLTRLREFERLRGLELQRCDIGDGDLAPLDALPGLRTLNLGGTKITDAGLARIGRYEGLEHLYLYSTPITDDGLAHLGGLTNLQQLFLENTDVTADGVARLQQSLRKTQISF